MPQIPKALADISEADLAKIRGAHRGNTVKVDSEWLMLAEFAERYGWQAYLDAKNDKVSLDELQILIQAGRKLDANRLYDASRAVLIGIGSANSKTPSSTFKKLTEGLRQLIKADV